MKDAFLVGNPNVGKTAVLNILTGSSYTIGNWAGVTVSRQEGRVKLPKGGLNLLDLPGLYSLSPCSEDEGISSNEIFFAKADLFINVIDVNNLHQNLMLSAELSELGIPIVGLLNFFDEFAHSRHIDLPALEEQLGYPLIPFSARTGQGAEELKNLLDSTPDFSVFKPKKRLCGQGLYLNLQKVFQGLEGRFTFARFVPETVPLLAQLSVGNEILLKKLAISHEALSALVDENLGLLPDFTQDLLDKKEILVRAANVHLKEGAKDHMAFTRAADSVLMHPFWGMVSFAAIITAFFSMVFNAANPLIDFIDWLIGSKLADYASATLADTPKVLQSFVSQGLISGVGSVLTFVPLIFILYTLLAFLEESGYLARIAVLLEAPLSKIGFSGKAFLPLMLGFGCNVPAIYGARVLETPQQRRLTALLAPLMSCGARLTVFALFAAAFFPNHGALVLTSLYFVGIALALGLGWVLSRFRHFASGDPCFVMVLPPYRIPNASVVLKTAWLHASSYVQKAGGLILGMLMLIWALAYFPAQGKVSDSYLARVGKAIRPAFVPLGFGERWEPVVSIVPSLVAKEAVVGFLGQTLSDMEQAAEAPAIGSFTEEAAEITAHLGGALKDSAYGLVTFNLASFFSPPDESTLEEEGGQGVVQKLAELWGHDPLAPMKAYSFMLFILLTLPCVASIAALKQELDSKSFWIAMALYLAMPYALSTAFYQASKLFVG